MLQVLSVVLATLVLVAALVRLVYPPIYRDLLTIVVLIRLIFRVQKSIRAKELIIDQFESQVKVHPDKLFLRFQDECYTYSQGDFHSTKAARALVHLGVTAGDTIAILMTNQPAFIWLYLGIHKLGARAALINHHLKEESLVHSVKCCFPKLLIVGSGDGLPQRIASFRWKFDEALKIVFYDRPADMCDVTCFTEEMTETLGSSSMTPEPIPRSQREGVKYSDACAFIYTSGTTGLPKPAIITHKKTTLCSHSYNCIDFTSSDVLYLTLPLYHASALNLALLNVINTGASVVIREKFSASQFWKDCVRYDVTCFQYIGEMLRYLVNSPQVAEETQHCVRFAVGNGLRPDIWSKFQARFKVKNIFEFYGSTECPATVNNLFNVTGSVGRLSPLLSKVTKQILVKLETEKNQPYRNSEGRCQLAAPGENGLLLAQLTSQVKFDGYLGPAHHTSSRILKDVLEVGDFYVNTNDVFTMDHSYNLYFKDRIGDSFRWKGENVSTAEVSNIMNSLEFVEDTNVFGVEVPGCEGKAGMAAIHLKEAEKIDGDKIDGICELVKKKLPAYARPRFLRVQRQMSLTSTFKQQKTELAKQGYNPETVDEPLYYLDKKLDEFKPLDADVYQSIIEGKISI